MNAILKDIIDWEDRHDVLEFKFQHSDVLVWPLIRCTVFNKIIENNRNLQVPHAVKEKLNVKDLLIYVYKTIADNPFSIRRQFDFLFFSNTSGISVLQGKKWLGRINDSFVLEYDDKSLVLDRSYRLRYRFPRVPKNVRCHDLIKVLSDLKHRIFGRISDQDKETIDHLMILLRDSWKEKLKGADYENIRSVLELFCLRLPYLRQYYLRLFEQVKPKVLFVEDASYGGSDAWVMKWAKDCGISTCEIQHGCISIPYMYSDRLKNDQEYKKYLPDHLLMYGQYWAGLVSSTSKTAVIGNPHFDLKKKEYGNKTINNSVKKILIVSQGTVTNMMVDLASQLAQKLEGKDYQITFRLHPGEVPFIDRYKKLENFRNIEVNKQGDIYQLITASDYIVGSYSLTLFEAAGLNKRVYVLENESSAEYIPQDLGLRFKNAEDLVELISKGKNNLIEKANYLWADHWKENYHRFINAILEKKDA